MLKEKNLAMPYSVPRARGDEPDLMQIETLPLAGLIPYARNARTHL